METLDAILQDDPAAAEPGLRGLRLRQPELAYKNLRQFLGQTNPPAFGAFFDELEHLLPANPDPDRALNNLERYQSLAPGQLTPLSLAAERPALLALLTWIMGQSRVFGDLLIRHPEYVGWLADPDALAEPTDVESFGRALRETLEAVSGTPEARLQATVRWQRRMLLRAAMRGEVARYLTTAHAEDTEIETQEDPARLMAELEFMRELSDLAIAVVRVGLEEATRELQARFGAPIQESGEDETGGHEASFAVLAMGKLGGGELNFSSDIDLIFLYSGEGRTAGVAPEGSLTRSGRTSNHDYFCRLGESLVRLLTEATDEGHLYRVDMRLRPDGVEGPLARSAPAFEIYHETQARVWERLALVKARAVAGNPGFCRHVDRLVEGLTYERPVSIEIIPRIAELKRRIDAEVETKKGAGREIKRGEGGIREIEFLAQTHQLLKGREQPDLRRRALIDALEALTRAGELDPDAARELAVDYLALRHVENRMQMVEMRQTHTLPDDPEELDALARRCPALGASRADQPGKALFDQWLAISGRVHAQFVDFFLPEGSDAKQGEEVPPAGRAIKLLISGAPEKEMLEALEALEPFGLAEPGPIKTLQRLAGLGRAFYLDEVGQEHFAALGPSLLEAASAAARPAAALVHFESYVSASGSMGSMYEILGSNSNLLTLLMKTFGAANTLAKTLIAHPEYSDYILDPSFLASASDAAAMARRLAGWLPDDPDAEPEAFAGGLARFRRFNSLMTGVREIGGLIDFAQATGRLSRAACVALEAAVARAAERAGLEVTEDGPHGFSILAMGKLGTGELNYFSDLDIVFCWDDTAVQGPSPRSDAAAGAIAAEVTQSLTAPTSDGAPFNIDARLRPEGKSAPLAPSLSRYLDYFAARADFWEFQSWMKIAHVAGDAALSERVITGVRDVIAERIEGMNDAKDIQPTMRAMRQRIEQAVKTPKWVLCDYKKGPGGVIDLEFIAQYLQLRNLTEMPETLGLAPGRVFEAMAEAGRIEPDLAESLIKDYGFLRRFESRARLLFETEKSHAPDGGEKWESLRRATQDLLRSDQPDMRDALLSTLTRNRERFDELLPP